MRRMTTGWMLGGLLLAACAWAQTDDLLLYAPFDGGADAAFARGEARQQGGLLALAPGLRGEAAVLRSDCLFAVPGNFRPEAGTIALWYRPHWPGSDPTGHYVFCLYGQRDLPESWARNRWSVDCSGGQCRFTIYTQDPGKSVGIAAPIGAWQADTWHHVAFTWSGINSGQPDAELRLYLDGKLAASLTGKQVTVGPTNDVMAVGRDQDGSPDYGDADADDLFIYSRPLAAQEIADGVAAARQLPYETAGAPGPAPRPAPGWWRAAWPYRAPVTLPPAAEPREQVFVQCPLRAGADLSGLGRSGVVAPDSLRVVEEGQTTPLPARVADGVVEWQAPGVTSADTTRRFHLYFQTDSFVYGPPLVAQRLRTSAEPPPALPPVPDYATLTYGKPWDFDDGTFAGIDQWGNKPEFLRNRKVEDGILSFDALQDPWFIWGDMWGQVRATNPVAIDLARFPVLEMKVRQSVPQATWELYGRVGDSPTLLHYDFPVTGTGWQRILIDLRQQARWKGVLSALRIDPGQNIGEAHIEFDWIRLLAVSPVAHGRVETAGAPSAAAQTVTVTCAQTTVPVASLQQVTVAVLAAGGQPVAGQPVRVVLGTGSGGQLSAAPNQPSLALSSTERRGLTDAQGQLRVLLTASRRAGPAADSVSAVVEFTSLPVVSTKVTTTPGPAHHYRVSPAKVVALKPDTLPLAVSAQLVDEFDNPVPGQRTLKWSTDPEAAVLRPGAKLDAKGQAAATWRGDESKRWVYHVRVTDDKGLSGESAAICLLPAKPRTDPIVLGPNGYFRRGPDGPAWLPLGGFYANWVGLPQDGEEGRKLVSFVDASEAEMDHWLAYLSSQGVNAMRFMLRAHTPRGMEPLDVIGRVNMPLFAKVLRYLDLARKYDIRFMLVIHEDYTKPAYYDERALDNFCLPQYAGEDLDQLPPFQRRFLRDRRLLGIIGEKYTDPDVMACQDQYTRQLLGLLKDNPQLFSWEFENEMVDCPQSWANHMADVIRAADPVTPICASHGGGGLHTADPLWWTKRTKIDFYTYHLYPHTGSTSAAVDFGAAADVLTAYGRMAGVCMFGETSGDEFGYYPKDRDADRRYIMRDLIWFPLVNGNPGCFFWNNRGFEVEQFKLARQITAGLDFREWRRQRPDLALVVKHPWEDDKYYRSPQGQADYWLMGRYAQHYLAAGADFDLTMDPAGYARTADLQAFAPVAASPLLSVTPGWQVRANAREGYGQGLAYIRNFAGVRNWQVPGKCNMFLRDRKAAPLTVTLHLPQAKVTVTATDLDTGESKRVETTGQGTVELGATDHDWALVWR